MRLRRTLLAGLDEQSQYAENSPPCERRLCELTKVSRATTLSASGKGPDLLPRSLCATNRHFRHLSCRVVVIDSGFVQLKTKLKSNRNAYD
jgi:hypothetical protein